MRSHCFHAQWISILSFIIGTLPLGKAQPDTVLIKQWIDSAWSIRSEQPESAMQLADQILHTSQDHYYTGHLNGLQLRGESFFIMGQMDSATHYYQRALELSLAASDDRETGNNYTSLSSILLNTGDRDSALYYLTLAITLHKEDNDSSALAGTLLRLGNVYNSMGKHDLALTTFFKSLEVSEALGDEQLVAYTYGSVGIIMDKQGEYQQAETYFKKALALFIEQQDLYGQMSTYNNLGILYKNKKDYKKALDAYDHTLVLADSMDYSRGSLSAHTNLGILNCQMGYFENGLQHNEKGLQLARTFEDEEAISDNLNWIARAQNGLLQYDVALKNATQALVIGRNVQSLEKQRDASLTLSEIYHNLHNYPQSLEYFKAYTLTKDSLYTLEKARQIAELQTAYETEKKDKEIQLLAKNVEIGQVRKTRLWVALGLSILAGSLLIYSQWVRRTRDKKILSQEKLLEVHRRQTAELETEKVTRELDFKKQELAAKALQLARKNEFLQSIHGEVDDLRAVSSGASAESVRKISRRIRMDIESEEDWDQFLASFRDVHREFIEHLQQTYPDISKSEIRMACLMKMNLSGKELAALLNISPDGVKKARYRLRKKMGLDSDIDIQEYLMSLPRIN